MSSYIYCIYGLGLGLYAEIKVNVDYLVNTVKVCKYCKSFVHFYFKVNYCFDVLNHVLLKIYIYFFNAFRNWDTVGQRHWANREMKDSHSCRLNGCWVVYKLLSWSFHCVLCVVIQMRLHAGRYWFWMCFIGYWLFDEYLHNSALLLLLSAPCGL